MALPALSRTWLFDVNRACSDSTEILALKPLVFALKNAIMSASYTSNAPTVYRSSNSLTTAYSDLWGSSSNVVLASAAHSWIVFNYPGIAPNAQVCIDCNYDYCPHFIMSANEGFVTGGTPSARPTAADECIILDQAAPFSLGRMNALSGWTSKAHTLIAADGTGVKFFHANYNQIPGHCGWEKPLSPVDGWTNPMVGWSTHYNGSGTNVTFNYLHYGTYTKGRVGSNAPFFAYLTMPYVTNSVRITSIANTDDTSGEWALSPMGIYTTTAASRGVTKGFLSDIYWGPEANANGTGYLNGLAERKFVQFGHVVVPWDGSIVQIS